MEVILTYPDGREDIIETDEDDTVNTLYEKIDIKNCYLKHNNELILPSDDQLNFLSNGDNISVKFLCNSPKCEMYYRDNHVKESKLCYNRRKYAFDRHPDCALYLSYKPITYHPYDLSKYYRPTYDTIKRAVNRRWMNLEYVDDQTEEICIIALLKSGHAINHIKNQTEKLCVLAVEKLYENLKLVKEQTENICFAASGHKECDLEELQYKSARVIRNSIVNNPANIKKVEQTEELIAAILEKSGNGIRYIKNPTKDSCIKALKWDGSNLRYIKNQTPELCKLAVKNNPESFMSVKDKTQDICEMAVKLIAKNIMHVPEELRTYELWKIAITKDAKLFDRCPFRDNAITILAVKGCHKNATIAKNLTDLELVKSNPLTIQYIKNKTDEILFHVISVDEKYIAYARGIPLLKAFEIVDMYPGTGRYFNIGFSDRKILDFYYNIKLNTTPYVNKHFFNNIVSATKENPEIFKYTVQIIKKFYRSKLSLFIELT